MNNATPRILLVSGVLLITSVIAVAQNGDPGEVRPLPRGFADIELGMDIAEVQQRLIDHPDFFYRGEPDVSLLPAGQDRVIETSGYAHIRRAFFQFSGNALFTITLLLNPQELDHYGLYTTLVERYGEPTSLSPQLVVWQSDRTRLSLERPLTVRYVDVPVFEQLVDDGRARRSVRELSRRRFLDQF